MPAVFVHGITVRKDRFDDLLESIKAGFQKRQPNLVIDGFYWGDMGSALRYGGASIPGFLEGKRAIEVATGEIADARQLMMLLLDDPLLELRLLRDVEEFDPAGSGFIPIPTEVEQRNQALEAARSKLVEALADDSELPKLAGKAVGKARWQDLVRAALDASGRADRRLSVADLIDPLTRCLTASLYREVEGEATRLDTAFRWNGVEARIQELLEKHLGGQRGWLGDKIKTIAGGAAAHGVTFAMRHGLRRRVMEATSIFIGDVLAYMAKRDEIQAELEKAVVRAIASSNSPLWLIGHSLGGILCFDYCLRTKRKVERLITVGSQVGLFGELGAFPALKPGANGALETPDCVEKWVNMYDPDDILSFLAAPVLTKAVDIEFDTEAPFPVSHSEYWHREGAYGRLVQ